MVIIDVEDDQEVAIWELALVMEEEKSLWCGRLGYGLTRGSLASYFMWT